MEKTSETAKEAQEQSNINNHSLSQFQNTVQKGLVEGGIHLNASKGHGKTRLLFNMAQTLRNQSDCRVLIFDGSEAWLYGFSKIPVFTITERDITLANNIETTEQIERYQLVNWNLVKLALASEKDLLFRLKSRKPSKRGFFIRTVINYLDALQRAQRETTDNNQPEQKIAYFIEEAQDAFNIRSTQKLEAEEFLTVFNEARNNLEAFYTCCQRETDFSKTIRTKQLMAYGKIPESDKTAYHRRLEKQSKVNFSSLPQRTWLFEGSTFVSPEFKQNGKPYQINKVIKQKWIESLPKSKKQSFFDKHIFPLLLPQTQKLLKHRSKMVLKEAEFEEEEDQEMDDMFLLDPLAEEP
jgi:hypothetical protein